MHKKIIEAQAILKEMDLPSAQQNQVAALSLLALCNIKPEDSWQNAERRSLIIADAMNFAAEFYDINYETGSRESFRKEALNPFVANKIADKNPDDPNLPQTSPKTHYAISIVALNTIRKYLSSEWEIAIENFIRYKNQIQQQFNPTFLIKELGIKSYKSIVNDSIELGRFNVFIGANGCGKTNILEALATVGAERGNDLNFDGLYSRGVRIARPDLILSSFLNDNRQSSIEINLTIQSNDVSENYKCSLSPTNLNDVYTKWVNLAEEEMYPELLLDYFTQIAKQNPGISGQELLDQVNEMIALQGLNRNHTFDEVLSEYAIFDLNTKSLRGITAADSKKTPLGINGEGIDLLISSFNSNERLLLNKCLSLFDWLGEIVPDKDDKFKLTGLKPGRSISTLYFRDRFMQKGNNTFSAENSNEGVLHVLFYLALFISQKTPKLLAIDNIETALNPRICRALITELVKLSKDSGKQALITTHNPAILDGMDLSDDEQRLFEVYRDNLGRTKTRRIKFKENLDDKKYRLSDMWLKGLIGGIPNNF